LIEPAVTQHLYRAAWVDGKNIGVPEVLIQVLNDAGFDGEALLEKTQQPIVKEQLKTNTQRAESLGCCGVPSFWVNDSVLVWGQDRFEQVIWALHGWRPKGE
jgi:2-hydroxychromene-2-carboxylate isomerase